MKQQRVLSFLIVLVLLGTRALSADTLQVCSPSGKICVQVWMGKLLTYQVRQHGQIILEPSFIDLEPVNKPAMSFKAAIKSSAVAKVEEEIISPVPEKRKIIPDIYNKLTLVFKQPYKIEFRAYDDGVAYRISTAFKDSIKIKNEVAEFRFPGTPSAYFPEIPVKAGEDAFKTSFEDLYSFKKIAEFPATSIAYTPVLIVPGATSKIAITESDLEDYPGMFLTGTGSAALKGIFAGYPVKETIAEALYSQVRVAEHGDFIALTRGNRTFPWRVLMISELDKDLPSNDLVYRLGSPSRVADVSWINPGNITDEWIIDVNLFNVPFKSGRNTASYKYYIDFAQRFGFDRIMMDAGWSDNNDLFKVNPDINMDTLVAYARAKGVKIAMWTLAMTLDRQLDSALQQFNRWGIDFIMTDFIDRDDQKSVNFHYRIAKACAEHKIMIMFHGTYPPKGFNRTYPNAVAREAVLGSEYNIWSEKVSPDHDVLLPYTRMLAGSLDYEPGALNNANKKSFRMIEGIVLSQGTRAHQAAMPVIFDSPMQFFSGNPSQGWLEPKYMELIGGIPTTWDETRVLDGKAGEFIITARRKGTNWYIGGMTGWAPRDLSVKLDFLDDGEYKTTLCKDGVNADHYAADYILENSGVKRNETLGLHLAPGGGFLLKLEKH
ncbi:glycoside hydrolase family 97 protein [Flavihumibacter profundi]|uniref:glycoside hydrolase family 97 protein n=1 Tax=Flavihumibacter profundi TaxID=2716883 RepID=UPI001CC57190|nr:glycoside hydrolase family 97 protein [Flavihumibacter profundi]MBZ5856004.1 glycoside hydrolase family 97 protein [Flavihumibacter profundi]